jgi:hypothetical protein
VFGGLPVSPARNSWNGNGLLIESHHQLKPHGQETAPQGRRLDIGIAVEHGAFDVAYGLFGTEITHYRGELALAAFLIRLLARLQDLGTVPAIDYNQYSKISIGHSATSSRAFSSRRSATKRWRRASTLRTLFAAIMAAELEPYETAYFAKTPRK